MAEQLDMFGDGVKVEAQGGATPKRRGRASASPTRKRNLAVEIPAKAGADIEAIKARDGLKTDTAAVVAALASYAGRRGPS